MITPEQALAILQDTIKHKRRHRHYTRVTELADLYHKLISGEGLDTLLKPFARRESEDEFRQRVNLTQQITPSLAESIIQPFYRPGRLDNIQRDLVYESDNGRKRERLEEVLSGFYGGEHVERYLSTRFADLNFTDPNAFILVDFDRFDARQLQAPQPYPYEISSHEAINYHVHRNKVEWLISYVTTEETNPATGRIKKQDKYYFYAPGFVLVATQEIDDTKDLPLYDGLEQALIPLKDFSVWGDNYTGTNTIGGKRFSYELFDTKSEEIQVVRIGYKLDKVTKGQTYVSPLQPAVPYFMKLVKSVSELDLSVSLHVFPQKATFEEPCPGTVEQGQQNPCKDGSDMYGNTCKRCNGSAVLTHRSSQDLMVYPLKKGTSRDEVVPLKDRVHYYELPIHIVNWLDQYVDKLCLKAVKAVYNSDIIERPQFASTATEVTENKEEMHNTLFPFTERYSSVYKHIVRLCATFTDLADGLSILFEFPSDYRLRTEAEMLLELKAAKDSNANAFYIQSIEDSIARKRFADDEESYLKYKVKTLFTPFLGKSENYILALFQSNDVRIEDKILYNFNDSIFDELQMEVPGFFSLAYSEQNRLVMGKVEKIKATLPRNEVMLNLSDTDTDAITDLTE